MSIIIKFLVTLYVPHSVSHIVCYLPSKEVRRYQVKVLLMVSEGLSVVYEGTEGLD